MKNLLFILLFIPFVSFGQTANEFAKGGFEKFKLKDYYGAIGDYTKAIEIKPNRGVYYSLRGDAKRELKDYYGAIGDYTKAIEIDPNDAYAYANRGGMKEILKNLKGACVDWKKAAELGNKDAADWLAQNCK